MHVLLVQVSIGLLTHCSAQAIGTLFIPATNADIGRALVGGHAKHPEAS